MDELLLDRIRELRDIDDRLERIIVAMSHEARVTSLERVTALTESRLRELRRDLAGLIAAAEREHAAF